MACFHPLEGWRGRVPGPSGKRPVVFNPSEGFSDLPVTVPCGQCIGCRLERSRQWAVRMMHEAKLHSENSFVTLTYSDEHMPEYGSLQVEDFQKFMKRLRKAISPRKVRFFHCGEYGEKTRRPHYHACLFGYDFPDKVQWTIRGGHPVWRSPTLEDLWPLGLSEIGTVSFESAAYVARYITKKVTGRAAEAHYERCDPETGELVQLRPEYTTMSRRPGIGAGWFHRFQDDVFPSDEVIVRGKAVKPPKYYDGLYEVIDQEGAREVRQKRQRNRSPENETPERLRVREVCTQARLSRFDREVHE